MKKEDKALLIDSLVETLNTYPHFYVVDVTALDSQTTSDLRRACFKNDIKLQVVKNTLFIKALERVGNEDFEALKPILKNTTGIMFCQVANQPAKLIKSFGKDHGDIAAADVRVVRISGIAILENAILDRAAVVPDEDIAAEDSAADESEEEDSTTVDEEVATDNEELFSPPTGAAPFPSSPQATIPTATKASTPSNANLFILHLMRSYNRITERVYGYFDTVNFTIPVFALLVNIAVAI